MSQVKKPRKKRVVLYVRKRFWSNQDTIFQMKRHRRSNASSFRNRKNGRYSESDITDYFTLFGHVHDSLVSIYSAEAEFKINNDNVELSTMVNGVKFCAVFSQKVISISIGYKKRNFWTMNSIRVNTYIVNTFLHFGISANPKVIEKLKTDWKWQQSIDLIKTEQ